MHILPLAVPYQSTDNTLLSSDLSVWHIAGIASHRMLYCCGAGGNQTS